MSLKHTSLAIFACLLWGSAFAGVKMSLRDVPPLTVAGVRFMLAGALLLPLFARGGAIGAALPKQWRIILTVSLLQTIVLYGTFFVGMTLSRGAQGAIIIGSAPLVTAMLAHFMMPADRMTVRQTAAIALGVIGVGIIAIASKPWNPAGLRELGGMTLISVGMIAGQLSNILVARHRGQFNPVLVNGAQMLVGGTVLFAIAMLVEGPPQGLPPMRFYPILLWLAVISAVGFSIWFWLLRKVKVSRLNMWKFLIPVFGVTLSWVLLPNESPDVSTVCGMVFVAAAVLMGHYRGAQSQNLKTTAG